MGLQGCEKGIDAFEKAIVDDALILVGFDFVLALEALLMDLVLLGTDEGTLVDIGVYFDVRVIAELESVLGASALRFQPGGLRQDGNL